MSGGSPWSTAGTMNAIMGRDLPVGMFALVTLHFLLSFIYVTVIAHAIYRLRVMSGIIVGVLTGWVLYGINFAIFHSLATQMQSPEGRALFVHFTFSLFASAAYKGASVPKPLRGGKTEVLNQTQAAVPQENPDDPEPVSKAADR